MSNKAITLFVFEGEKQESQYLSIFLKALSIDIQRIEIAFCTHIYTLHNKLKKDANLDTFELFIFCFLKKMVVMGGLEPPTLAL